MHTNTVHLSYLMIIVIQNNNSQLNVHSVLSVSLIAVITIITTVAFNKMFPLRYSYTRTVHTYREFIKRTHKLMDS